MSLFVEAICVAAAAQATVGVIAGIGIAASASGVLVGDTMKTLSQFHLLFLQPCVILQLSRYYSLERVASWGSTTLLSWVHIALGGVLGWSAAGLAKLDRERKALLALSTAYGNCGALPFVLILPIVLNWSVTRESETALETGLGVIGLYLTGWFVSFFTIGKAFAERIKPSKPLAYDDAAAASTPMDAASMLDTDVEGAATPAPTSSASPHPSASCTIDGVEQTPPSGVAELARNRGSVCARGVVGQLLALARKVERAVYCMCLSVTIGCVPSLRRALEAGGSLGWLGDAWHTLGTAGICLSTVMLGASLWGSSRARAASRRAASVETQMPSAAHVDTEGACFVLLSCVLRLLVLPAVCLPLHLWLRAIGALSPEPTVLMVLTISTGVPSSQTMVILLNAIGATRTAEQAAQVYVPMYLWSILTVSALIITVCVIVG